jgi:hypothetical protein
MPFSHTKKWRTLIGTDCTWSHPVDVVVEEHVAGLFLALGVVALRVPLLDRDVDREDGRDQAHAPGHAHEVGHERRAAASLLVQPLAPVLGHRKLSMIQLTIDWMIMSLLMNRLGRTTVPGLQTGSATTIMSSILSTLKPRVLGPAADDTQEQMLPSAHERELSPRDRWISEQGHAREDLLPRLLVQPPRRSG